MRQRVLHITSLLLLMAAAFPCLVSCTYEGDLDNDRNDKDDNGKAILMLRAASLDSRSATSDVERLHSLRVIILHANGTLEHNYYVSDLGSDGVEQHDHLFTVSGMETKTIYLVANEGSIPGLTQTLNGLGANPAQTLEQITFEAVPSSGPAGNPAFTNGIPMSACYEVAMGGKTRVEKDFFLVKAMTKFTFTFENIRTDGVTLKEMKVGSFADKTYLFPQFIDGNSEKVNSENFQVDSVGNYAPESGTFWIDWLKEAVEKSQTDLYTPDSIGWIKNYTLPTEATHTGTTTNIAPDFSNAPVLKSSESWTYPQAFYRCESMNGTPQEYAISYLRVKAGRDVSDMEWKNKPVLKLTQVKYLFRHTHVKVNVVFGQEDVVIYARIHPWIVIKPTEPLPLEPED